jgi:hypothetical protein
MTEKAKDVVCLVLWIIVLILLLGSLLFSGPLLGREPTHKLLKRKSVCYCGKICNTHGAKCAAKHCATRDGGK